MLEGGGGKGFSGPTTKKITFFAASLTAARQIVSIRGFALLKKSGFPEES